MWFSLVFSERISHARSRKARKQPRRSPTLTSDSGIAAAALGQDFTEQVLAAAASEVSVVVMMMMGRMKVVVVASSFHAAGA